MNPKGSVNRGNRAVQIRAMRLRREGHPLFASQFDCNAPLSPGLAENRLKTGLKIVPTPNSPC